MSAIDAVEKAALNENPAACANTGGVKSIDRRASRREKTVPTSFRRSLPSGQGGALPMLPPVNSLARGPVVRRALLAIIRLCHERNAPIPSCAVLADLVGIHRSQVARHLDHMMNDGLFNVQSRGGKRRYVQELRA